MQKNKQSLTGFRKLLERVGKWHVVSLIVGLVLITVFVSTITNLLSMSSTRTRVENLCNRSGVGESIEVVVPLLKEFNAASMVVSDGDKNPVKGFKDFSNFNITEVRNTDGQLTVLIKGIGMVYFTCTIEFKDRKIVSKGIMGPP